LYWQNRRRLKPQAVDEMYEFIKVLKTTVIYGISSRGGSPPSGYWTAVRASSHSALSAEVILAGEFLERCAKSPGIDVISGVQAVDKL
jgi:hypothetical protein